MSNFRLWNHKISLKPFFAQGSNFQGKGFSYLSSGKKNNKNFICLDWTYSSVWAYWNFIHCLFLLTILYPSNLWKTNWKYRADTAYFFKFCFGTERRSKKWFSYCPVKWKVVGSSCGLLITWKTMKQAGFKHIYRYTRVCAVRPQNRANAIPAFPSTILLFLCL